MPDTAFVAKQHLKWGEKTIPPGSRVPDDEPGRNYDAMLRTGMIERVDPSNAPPFEDDEDNDETFDCTFRGCDRTFVSQRGLKQHISKAHKPNGG